MMKVKGLGTQRSTLMKHCCLNSQLNLLKPGQRHSFFHHSSLS